MDAVADALLAAVFASPADDTPRLVYADHLDETGTPANAARAEFIRVQCELARRPADDPGCGELTARAAELYRAHGRVWERLVQAQLGARRRPRAVEFRRGFVASLRVKFGDLSDRPDRVFAAGPLEHLSLVGEPRPVRDAARVRRLTAVTVPRGYARAWMWGNIAPHHLGLTDVPVLISDAGFPDAAVLFGYAAERMVRGLFNPVVVVPATSTSPAVVFDPLRLWPTVAAAVAPYTSWTRPNVVSPELSRRDAAAAERTRYRHLVWHYQRYGWPPHEPRPREPEPEMTPIPTPEPRSLLARVSGWLRGR